MKTPLLRATILTGAAMLVLGLAKTAYNVVVGRAFGAEALGHANLALSIMLTVALLASAATQPTATKFLAEFRGRGQQDAVHYVWWVLAVWTAGVGALLMVVLYLARDWTAQLFDVDRVLYLGALPLIFLGSLYYFARGALYGLDRVTAYAVAEIVGNLAMMAALVLLVLGIFDNLVAPIVVLYVVFGLACLRVFLPYLRPPRRHALQATLAKYGAVTMVGSISTTSRLYFSYLFAGALATTTEVGLYAAAFAVNNAIVLLPQALGAVMTPAMAHQWGRQDKAGIHGFLERTTHDLFIVGALLTVPLMMAARPVLALLYGADFAYGADGPLQLLLVGTFLVVVTRPSVSAMVATDQVSVPNISGAIALGLSIVAWMVAIPKFGVVGTAMGYLVGTLFSNGFVLWRARRIYGLRLGQPALVSALSALLLVGQAILRIDPWAAAAVSIVVLAGCFHRALLDLWRSVVPSVLRILKESRARGS